MKTKFSIIEKPHFPIQNPTVLRIASHTTPLADWTCLFAMPQRIN
jgi:hypothetical protein